MEQLNGELISRPNVTHGWKQTAVGSVDAVSGALYTADR